MNSNTNELVTFTILFLTLKVSLLSEIKINEKTCTSSKIACIFNVTNEPRVHYTELSGARPYSKICRYNRRLYQLGWNVPVKENPCKQCTCNEFWDDLDPLNSLSCRDINCESELQTKLREGCVPVYSDDICCPTDYYCRQQCVYNGSRFAIGSQLFLKFDEHTCDQCLCSSPPTFTCVNIQCSQTSALSVTRDTNVGNGCCALFHCTEN